MIKPVVLHARADADIDSALDYYLTEAPTRVDELLAEFQRTIARIGKAPGRGSPRYSHVLDLPGLRCVATHRFPYLNFYLEGSAEISIIRVLHQRRELPPNLEPE